MKDTLEYKILKYLSENNNGEPVEVSHLDAEKKRLKNGLSNLRKENHIICRVITNENIIAKIEFKGIKYLKEIENKELEKVKLTIVAENYIGGDNHGNQSSNNFSNNPITNNTIANPNNDLKANSIMLKFWKLISENKLISSLLLVIILWAIKEIFNIDLKI